jgi:hypothetical protein
LTLLHSNIAMRIIAVTLFVCILFIAGSSSYVIMRQLVLALSGDGGLLSPSISETTKTPLTNEEGTPLPGNDSSIIQTTLTPWDGAGRVTMLCQRRSLSQRHNDLTYPGSPDQNCRNALHPP